MIKPSCKGHKISETLKALLSGFDVQIIYQQHSLSVKYNTAGTSTLYTVYTICTQL